jgi:2-dehydro-3-deoxy-D-arabinonate dehydratase
MKLCRFLDPHHRACIGLVFENAWVLDLTAEGIDRLSPLFEIDGLTAKLNGLAGRNLPRYKLGEVRLLPPVERQEVWAAGVTYLRSKAARMEESNFSATAYDRVYDAARPELFFKSMPEKVAGPGEAVGVRTDSTWNVPEPELALLINSRGQIAGYTIGNDMSSRSIEGENLLYLPQAKIYDHSCALGPFVRVGATEAEARTWTVSLRIQRGPAVVFEGQTSVGNIKRPFEELVSYLFRSQTFPHGAILLTGTGIVPGNDFTLHPGDAIQIDVSGIGTLANLVTAV